MAYLPRTDSPPIPQEQIVAQAGALGLTIPPEDLAELSRALADQLASLRRIEALDLQGVAPVLQFDPRWHD